MGATYGGREWKIIGHLVTESTLKTAARVMERTDSASVAMLPVNSEPFLFEVYVGSLEQPAFRCVEFIMRDEKEIAPRFFLLKDDVLPWQRQAISLLVSDRIFF